MFTTSNSTTTFFLNLAFNVAEQLRMLLQVNADYRIALYQRSAPDLLFLYAEIFDASLALLLLSFLSNSRPNA